MLILFDIQLCIHWCWSGMSLICRNCRRFLWDLVYFPILNGEDNLKLIPQHQYTNKYKQTRNVFKQGTRQKILLSRGAHRNAPKGLDTSGYKWYVAEWMFHILPRTSIFEFTGKGHLVLFSDRWLRLKILRLHWWMALKKQDQFCAPKTGEANSILLANHSQSFK